MATIVQVLTSSLAMISLDRKHVVVGTDEQNGPSLNS